MKTLRKQIQIRGIKYHSKNEVYFEFGSGFFEVKRETDTEPTIIQTDGRTDHEIEMDIEPFGFTRINARP